MKVYYLLLSVLIFQSCYYGVNEKTSAICSLETDCLYYQAWNQLETKHSTNEISDSILLEKLDEFKILPFEVYIFYFKDSPEELIAVSTDHFVIRYVYNKKISDNILDGLSPKLKDDEKKRIRARIQNILMEHQCEAGRTKSLNLLNSDI